MKLSQRPARDRRPSRPRPRYGYDHRWWGISRPVEAIEAPSYWRACRRPLPCLIFLLPILLGYELGVAWLGGDALRTGSDAWVRSAFAAVGLRDPWWPPAALVLALLGWQAADRRDWTFPPAYLVGMAVESVVLAMALVGLGRLVDLGFHHLEGLPALSADGGRGLAAPLVEYLGAGLYEEAVFRLGLIPAILLALRPLRAPGVLDTTVAMTASALVFSLAHHAGGPGEPFTWFAFLFRWSAGVFFAWAFLARGLGIAVGTHAAYDILVGSLGWSP